MIYEWKKVAEVVVKSAWKREKKVKFEQSRVYFFVVRNLEKNLKRKHLCKYLWQLAV